VEHAEQQQQAADSDGRPGELPGEPVVQQTIGELELGAQQDVPRSDQVVGNVEEAEQAGGCGRRRGVG